MGGNAIVAAAAKLRDTVRAAAAKRWGCAAKEVEIDAGAVLGPDRQSLPLAAFAGTSAEASYASNKRTYSYGAHAAHVAVDPKTGHVELLDYVAVEDAGRIINPLTARNQIQGAVVMGIGMAFFEHTTYDPQNGAPINSSLADYLVTVNADAPPIDVHFLNYPDTEINELGARGMGEIGLTGIAAALTDAVHHATGVRVRELPVKIENLIA
jgi:CO/xanthine dehydrogenase Mo-binding subunit